jgi:hypothetical protein
MRRPTAGFIDFFRVEEIVVLLVFFSAVCRGAGVFSRGGGVVVGGRNSLARFTLHLLLHKVLLLKIKKRYKKK